MIRNATLISLTIGGFLVALAWAASFYSYDFRVNPPSRLHSYIWYANDKRACYFVTSLRGWLRFCTVRRTSDVRGVLPEPDDRGAWLCLFRTWPDPELAKTGIATAHLGGLVLVGEVWSHGSGMVSGFAVPHWFISLLLLTYPTIAFIRGPLRRRRRRKRGLCPSCGYNLTGNTSGVCPECSTKVNGP